MMDGVSYQPPNTCPDPPYCRQGTPNGSNATKELPKSRMVGTAMARAVITGALLICKHQSRHTSVHSELNHGSAAAPATPHLEMGEQQPRTFQTRSVSRTTPAAASTLARWDALDIFGIYRWEMAPPQTTAREGPTGPGAEGGSGSSLYSAGLDPES